MSVYDFKAKNYVIKMALKWYYFLMQISSKQISNRAKQNSNTNEKER